MFSFINLSRFLGFVSTNHVLIIYSFCTIKAIIIDRINTSVFPWFSRCILNDKNTSFVHSGHFRSKDFERIIEEKNTFWGKNSIVLRKENTRSPKKIERNLKEWSSIAFYRKNSIRSNDSSSSSKIFTIVARRSLEGSTLSKSTIDRIYSVYANKIELLELFERISCSSRIRTRSALDIIRLTFTRIDLRSTVQYPCWTGSMGTIPGWTRVHFIRTVWKKRH